MSTDRDVEHARTLLLRGTDPELPGRSWWFTPAGGREPGEGPRTAAVRDVVQETGLPGDLLDRDRASTLLVGR